MGTGRHSENEIWHQGRLLRAHLSQFGFNETFSSHCLNGFFLSGLVFAFTVTRIYSWPSGPTENSFPLSQSTSFIILLFQVQTSSAVRALLLSLFIMQLWFLTRPRSITNGSGSDTLSVCSLNTKWHYSIPRLTMQLLYPQRRRTTDWGQLFL